MTKCTKVVNLMVSRAGKLAVLLKNVDRLIKDRWRQLKMRNEFELFNEDCERICDMEDDWNLTPKDFYDEFSKMCLKYSDSSVVPYSLCCEIILGGYSCEEYYMQMLMDVYSFYSVGEDFLETLQHMIKCGYCDDCQKKTHELIKDYIQDGYIIAYRGEFATEDIGNLDYKQSVSYSLDYEHAKHFATRFNALPLKKSTVYTVKVPINDVLAYIERENEVICLPVCIGGKMEVIKEDSFV